MPSALKPVPDLRRAVSPPAEAPEISSPRGVTGAGVAASSRTPASFSDQLLAIQPDLWRFAWHLTRDDQEAADLMQSASLRVLERQHQFIAGSSMQKWACQVMFTIFVDRRRQRARRPSVSIEWADGVMTEARAETIVLAKETLAAIGQLSDAKRDVMFLSVDHGPEAVAAYLGIPIGTARSRLSRARDELCAAVGEKRVTAQPVWRR